jgi:hypothetical protein
MYDNMGACSLRLGISRIRLVQECGNIFFVGFLVWVEKIELI